MLDVLRKGYRLIGTIAWQLRSLVWIFTKKKMDGEKESVIFSIGIVTYIDRYNKFFKPLINQLTTIYPNTEILIAVNGYYDLDRQAKYLTKIKLFLSSHKNIKIIDFEQAQSLSKLWNLLIINSSNRKTLILNDDVKLLPSICKKLSYIMLLNSPIVLINRSWSHFIIEKSIIEKNGWFDERFPGVGNEDEDYECRLVFNGIYPKSIHVNAVKNIVFQTKDFSYGSNTEIVNKKYVKENQLFFNTKWEISDIPQDGFKYVEIMHRFVKPKSGMSTPNFYS